MASALAATLARGVDALALPIPEAAQATLLDYIALLGKWNRTYNLTSIREPAKMLTHHVLDALAALPHVANASALRILDVGSGGGVPGIPWAIARPGWQVTLVESNHKKSAFLTQASIELGLRNLQVRDIRVEALSADTPYDLVTSRAFSDLATFVSLAARLVAPEGMLVAMKGEMPNDEIAALPPDIAVLRTIPLAVPGLNAARHLVLLQPRSAA
jgi:16S rRNA (guanine527-N7)-methyltransferase